MSELHFYTNPQSRGRMIRWLLEEADLDYETHILSYGGTMKAPEYLAINRMGKVPAIRHGGNVVTEVAAICAYLAETFPQAGLGPEPEERADFYRWLFFAAGPLEAAISNHELGFEVPPKKQGMIGYGRIADVTATLAEALADRPYICGEHFRAADLYLGSQLSWALESGMVERLPVFEAYTTLVFDRPALVRATALDDAA